ncbi:MAG: hypothetical protein U9P44_01470 [archaeon]|nr:hypothetical protein [archaeon]
MRRTARMDLNMVTLIILAVVLIAIVSIIVLKVTGSGEEEGEDIITSLECMPRIAQACMDGDVTDEEKENSGGCITDSNMDTVCDSV